MFVCSCNIITDHDIERAVAELKAADPHVVLTPGIVFRALFKRPSCGTCLPLFSRIMMEADAALDNQSGARPNSARTSEKEPAPGGAMAPRRRNE